MPSRCPLEGGLADGARPSGRRIWEGGCLKESICDFDIALRTKCDQLQRVGVPSSALGGVEPRDSLRRKRTVFEVAEMKLTNTRERQRFRHQKRKPQRCSFDVADGVEDKLINRC